MSRQEQQWTAILNDSHAESSSTLSQEQVAEIMANWSIDHSEFDLLHRPAWRGLLMTLYILVILLGLLGNTVVVFVVVRNRKMQNVTNIFIANLALSDISLSVYSLPIQLYYQLTDNWIFGEVMCRILFAAFLIPLYVSVWTILLIALDRYWLIVYPLKERMSTRTAMTLIGIDAGISVLFSIPIVIFTKLHTVVHEDLGIDRTYCVETWPNGGARIAYSSLMFIFLFCLPLLLTTILYYRIYIRLQHRPSTRIVNPGRKQKTNKILLSIVTLFVVCWLPWALHSYIAEVEDEIVKGSHFKLVDVTLKLWAMTSSCVNPFLYCWLNDNFRKELDSMAIRLKIYRGPNHLSRCQSRRRHRNSPQNIPQFQVQPMIEEHGPTIMADPANTDCGQYLTVEGYSSQRLSTTRLSTTRMSATSNMLQIPL